MLSRFGLSKDFWVEAINMACYLVNRSPSTIIEFKTPFEVWFGTLANYSILRVFGCPIFAHVNDGKLEQRENRCIFLGYALGIKGYRLWCMDSGSPWLIISGDMKFDKFSIVDQSKESIEIVKDHSVGEQVKLKIEALWIVALGEEIVSLQYLKGTANVDLVYYRDSTESSSIVGFVDSNFIGDLDKKRFLTGYVFTFGCAISWEATLQSMIVLSTTGTEYMAAMEAVKVAIWLKGLVGDLGL